jgi:hypothetical protein
MLVESIAREKGAGDDTSMTGVPPPIGTFMMAPAVLLGTPEGPRVKYTLVESTAMPRG